MSFREANQQISRINHFRNTRDVASCDRDDAPEAIKMQTLTLARQPIHSLYTTIL
jgi:hypothetical protein